MDSGAVKFTQVLQSGAETAFACNIENKQDFAFEQTEVEFLP